MRQFIIYLVAFMTIGINSCLGKERGNPGNSETAEQDKHVSRIKHYRKMIKETLPFKDVLWEGVVPHANIKRFTLQEKFLYVESKAPQHYDLRVIRKEDGIPQWILYLDDALDFPLTTIKGIPAKEAVLRKKIKRLRKELAEEESMRPQDEIKVQNLRLSLESAREYFKTLKRHDFIYFISKGTLYCVDRNIGVIVWHKRLRKFVPSTGPVASFTAVYIGALDFDRLYQFDVEARYARNFFRAKGLITTPTVYEDPLVYFGCADGKIYAFHTIKLRPQWEYPTEGCIKAALIIDGDTIYVGSSDFAFYAIDRYTGRLRWKLETGQPITTQARIGVRRVKKENIVTMERTVYFRVDQDALYALELIYQPTPEEGIRALAELRWKFPEGKRFVMYGIANCYVLGMDNQTLYALDIESGEVKKKYSLAKFPFRIADPNEHVLYLGTDDGYIFAVREPRPRW